MIKLFNIDCMEAMAEMPDNAFDLAIVDPPYGIKGDRSFVRKTPSIDKRSGKPIRIKPRRIGNWDMERPPFNYFQELQRVSKNQIIFGGNYFADLLKASSCWIVWDKVNGKSDQADCELLWTSFSTAVRQLRFMWGIIQGKGAVNGHIAEGNNKFWDKKYHPNQKPIVLYKWLLKNYAKEGDKILDTHLGSMSSVIACIDYGFSITGFEIDEDYFIEAKKRIQQHLSQLNAFQEMPEISFNDKQLT